MYSTSEQLHPNMNLYDLQVRIFMFSFFSLGQRHKQCWQWRGQKYVSEGKHKAMGGGGKLYQLTKTEIPLWLGEGGGGAIRRQILWTDGVATHAPPPPPIPLQDTNSHWQNNQGTFS